MYEAPPSLVRTPWELQRSRPQTARKIVREPLKSKKFAQLPVEVMRCILGHLKQLHSTADTMPVIAYQQDLRSLCLLTRLWYRAAREYLYGDLWLPCNEYESKPSIQLKKPLGRLKLLLRTLTRIPDTCELVRTVRCKDALQKELESEEKTYRLSTYVSSMNLLTEIIRICPRTEHFLGYIPTNIEFNTDLLNALSSCNNLASHVWHLCTYSDRNAPTDISKYHRAGNWQQLELLVIWQPPGGYDFGLGAISAITQRLPALKHLALRGLSPTDFHDGTLLTLPALRSLRLEDLSGVTDQGMEQFSYCRLATSLQKLSLIGLELLSLQAIKTLLGTLSKLRSFRLVQKASPEIPKFISTVTSNFYLASPTMQYLHWDTHAEGHDVVTLTNSIAAGRFPSMARIKLPYDADGMVQNLCRPMALKAVTEDDWNVLREWDQADKYERSLRISQIQAQIRARKRMLQLSHAGIEEEDDPDGMEYDLTPDIRGSESAVARLDEVLCPEEIPFRDQLGRGEEAAVDLDTLF